ncbi:hypothetical protein [Moorena sp. SIO4G3]|uniref:hypothetical protein n=1 Tax=Moorena sp. SIO4G3 TaxID=2607821 RepID=UPI00142C2B69|nr:hypothetical protein [Moorena sp. SIO4G3]NEO82433.1 hypothetical protein [Moorena sp. SIO4G3]
MVTLRERFRFFTDSRFPIPDSRFPIPDSRFPIPDSLVSFKLSLKKKFIKTLDKLIYNHYYYSYKPKNNF